MVSANTPPTLTRLSYGFCPLRYAGQLSVGDEVMGYEEDELTPTRVISVSRFTMQGMLILVMFSLEHSTFRTQ